jgi:hypothetical protein
MKRLPEKMVMAAIILSCGFVSHSKPAAKTHTAGKSQHKWHVFPAQAAASPAKVAKAFNVRGDLP